MPSIFSLHSPFEPSGDQPQAIKELCAGLDDGLKNQVLLGVTGSGKTYTMAKVIEQSSRPALIMAPNKTLAAQLYTETKEFFPENHVEYFVSYYDFYQPEAYVPKTDTYIEKDSAINEQIDRMRNSATRSLLEYRDVIIVASVSCIYGLGDVDSYSAMTLPLKVGQEIAQKDICLRLAELNMNATSKILCVQPSASRGTLWTFFRLTMKTAAGASPFLVMRLKKLTSSIRSQAKKPPH